MLNKILKETTPKTPIAPKFRLSAKNLFLTYPPGINLYRS